MWADAGRHIRGNAPLCPAACPRVERARPLAQSVDPPTTATQTTPLRAHGSRTRPPWPKHSSKRVPKGLRAAVGYACKCPRHRKPSRDMHTRLCLSRDRPAPPTRARGDVYRRHRRRARHCRYHASKRTCTQETRRERGDPTPTQTSTRLAPRFAATPPEDTRPTKVRHCGRVGCGLQSLWPRAVTASRVNEIESSRRGGQEQH
jgi:hypothetical protein